MDTTCDLDAKVDASSADCSVAVLHQAGVLLPLRMQPVPPLRVLYVMWTNAQVGTGGSTEHGGSAHTELQATCSPDMLDCTIASQQQGQISF